MPKKPKEYTEQVACRLKPETFEKLELIVEYLGEKRTKLLRRLIQEEIQRVAKQIQPDLFEKTTFDDEASRGYLNDKLARICPLKRPDCTKEGFSNTRKKEKKSNNNS